MSVAPLSTGSASYAPPAPSSQPVGLDALARGDAAAPGGASITSQPSTYQTQLTNLNQYDAAELIQTSLASPTDALSNVQSVLAQAANLQQQQQLTSQQSQAAIAQGTAPVANADPTGALNVPTFGSIIQASDASANADLTGANVNTTA